MRISTQNSEEPVFCFSTREFTGADLLLRVKTQTFGTLNAKAPAEILFYVCTDNSDSNILEVF